MSVPKSKNLFCLSKFSKSAAICTYIYLDLKVKYLSQHVSSQNTQIKYVSQHVSAQDTHYMVKKKYSV
jgi:hypothetical protein